MTEREFQESIALYALGSLEPTEAARVELYLKNNPEAHTAYLWYLESVAILAKSAPQEAAPKGIKAALKRQIQKSSKKKLYFLPSGFLGRRLELAPPFAFGLAVVAIGLLFSNQQQRQNLQSLQLEMRHVERLLATKQTQTFLLQTPNKTRAVGRVFISPEKEVLVSHTMGILPRHKTWQAWYFRTGQATPISLGTTSEAHLLIRLPDGANAVAVSEEPIGGSSQPTLVRAVAQVSF